MSLLNLDFGADIGEPLEPDDEFLCYAPPLVELPRLAEAEREKRTPEDWAEVAKEEGDRREFYRVFRAVLERD